MQVTSLLSAGNSATYPSATSSAVKSKPEEYLTDSDVKMIERLSGTTTLADAELNPNAKALAVSLGTKRQNGWIQGDASQYYGYAQLTDSDAKMIESMTGTTTVIDAMFKADGNVTGLVMDIAQDRGDGSLSGDVTTDYLQKLVDFDNTQLAYVKGHGISPSASGISVSIDTLNQAIEYLKEEAGTTPTSSITV